MPGKVTTMSIKRVVVEFVEKEKWILVKDIQEIVKVRHPISEEEENRVHDSEKNRNSNYPAWKRSLQRVLQEMKEKGQVDHDSSNHSYYFH